MRDNKREYMVKQAGWDRWSGERQRERAERDWMDEVQDGGQQQRSALADRRNADYRRQQAHFAAAFAAAAASASAGAGCPRLSDASTSYASIGSHLRMSAAAPELEAPVANGNASTFLSSSKRLGIDGSTLGAAAWATEAQQQYAAAALHEAKEEAQEAQGDAADISSAYALGYGARHRQYRTYLNAASRGQAGDSEQQQAEGEHWLAMGLGYSESHRNYYPYLRQTERRDR